MNAEIIPFDFEENAVRVILRDGEPWFVAADVCRVLEIENSRDAVSRLDEDERDMVNLNTVGSSDGIRGNPNATIISESGLYALIFTSRKEAAKRFRKWVTAEVLPALRRAGRYEMPQAQQPEDSIAGMPLRQADLWLQMVREARLSRGPRAAVGIWARSPLPPLDAGQGVLDPGEGLACLVHLLAFEVAGAQLSALIDAARAGDLEGAQVLSGFGLRVVDAGLFVANRAACDPFAGTRWGGGAHRNALIALDNVRPDPVSRTLAGIATRGVIVPLAHLDHSAGEDA